VQVLRVEIAGHGRGDLVDVAIRQLDASTHAIIEERQEMDLLNDAQSTGAGRQARQARQPQVELGRVVVE
jgi:hypothetical protein